MIMDSSKDGELASGDGSCQKRSTERLFRAWLSDYDKLTDLTMASDVLIYTCLGSHCSACQAVPFAILPSNLVVHVATVCVCQSRRHTYHPR